MNVKKFNYISLIIIYTILFALISVVCFVIFKPGKMENPKCVGVFWWSYGFLCLSYLAQIAVLFVVNMKKGMNALFLGIPLFVISIGYFAIELFMSLIFMFLSSVNVATPYSLVIVLHVVALGLYLCMAIFSLMTQKTINAIDEKQEMNIRNIRNLVADVELAAEIIVDAEVKKMVMDLAEDIRYSDPMSIDLVKDVEERLNTTILDIKLAASTNDLNKIRTSVQVAKFLVKERNIKIANNK